MLRDCTKRLVGGTLRNYCSSEQLISPSIRKIPVSPTLDINEK